MNGTTPGSNRPIARVVAIVATATLVGIGVALLVGNPTYIPAHGGEDLRIYLDHTDRWLHGGSYYDPRQLTGQPYQHVNEDSLYPPPSAIFFLPFLWVPWPVWWLVPLAVIVASVIRSRPSFWVWPLIAACAVAPRTISLTIYGNTTMWVAASVAAALSWRIPSVLVLLKPTLLPFALIDVRRRAWWVGLAGLGIASVAMLPMWSDWLTAVLNLRGDDWTHNGFDVAYILIPVIAWLGTPGRVRGWRSRTVATVSPRPSSDP
jgi:hypothetical protein